MTNSKIGKEKFKLLKERWMLLNTDYFVYLIALKMQDSNTKHN